MIFLIVVDCVIRETVIAEKNEIQWTLTQYLEDVADDLWLISQKHQQIQAKTDKLTHTAAKTELKVNVEKTKIMKLQTKQQMHITLEEHELEEEEYFTYLDSLVTESGGADEDVKTRTGKAR